MKPELEGARRGGSPRRGGVRHDVATYRLDLGPGKHRRPVHLSDDLIGDDHRHPELHPPAKNRA